MFKRKIGLNIITELLLDSSLFVTANCVCCLEHWVPAALFKNHKAFPILIYLSADLAAVLVFISWGTEEQFVPAKTLMSSIQKGLTSFHRRASRLPLLPVEARGPLCLRRWAQPSVKGTLTFCRFRGGDFQMQQMGRGCAEQAERSDWWMQCCALGGLPQQNLLSHVSYLVNLLGSYKEMPKLIKHCKLLQLLPFSLWSVVSDCGRILCLWG